MIDIEKFRRSIKKLPAGAKNAKDIANEVGLYVCFGDFASKKLEKYVGFLDFKNKTITINENIAFEIQNFTIARLTLLFFSQTPYRTVKDYILLEKGTPFWLNQEDILIESARKAVFLMIPTKEIKKIWGHSGIVSHICLAQLFNVPNVVALNGLRNMTQNIHA